MNRPAVIAIARRDLLSVLRNPGVSGPMIAVPIVLVAVTSLITGLASRLDQAPESLRRFLEALPTGVLPGIEGTNGAALAALLATYIIPPLLVIVPLMAASVLATDSIAGERERGTLEGLLLTPASDREILVGKLLGALLPAAALGLLAHLAYAVVADLLLAPTLGRPVLPTLPWLVTVLWFGPAFTAAALGLVVIVSARARTVQAAYQVSGVCVLPLILVTIGQATGVLLLVWWVALLAGAVLWALAVVLVQLGARSLEREHQLVSLG